MCFCTRIVQILKVLIKSDGLHTKVRSILSGSEDKHRYDDAWLITDFTLLGLSGLSDCASNQTAWMEILSTTFLNESPVHWVSPFLIIRHIKSIHVELKWHWYLSFKSAGMPIYFYDPLATERGGLEKSPRDCWAFYEWSVGILVMDVIRVIGKFAES